MPTIHLELLETSRWRGDEIDANGRAVFSTPGGKRPSFIVDSAHRRDLVETVRRATPGIDVVNGLRAVRTLATMRTHPERAHAIAQALAANDHTIVVTDLYSRMPDVFESRKHETVARRSRKGRTTLKRVKVGIPQVIGDRYVAAAPYDPDEIDLEHRAMVSADLVALAPYKTYGASSLMLTRIADRRYSALGLPRLIGTDVEAWASVIPGDVSSRCSSAVQRSTLVSALSVASPAVNVALKSVYVTDTSSEHRTATFPVSRLKLRRVSARRGDPGAAARESIGKDGKRHVSYHHEPIAEWSIATPDRFNASASGYARCIVRTVRYVMPTDRIPVRWTTERITTRRARVNGRYRTVPVVDTIEHLSTITPETLWVGHELVARPSTVRAERAVKSAQAEAETLARTDTVPAPDAWQAWLELLDNLATGRALNITYPDGTVRTVTRSKDGRYASGGRADRWQVRSATSAATRLIA